MPPQETDQNIMEDGAEAAVSMAADSGTAKVQGGWWWWWWCGGCWRIRKFRQLVFLCFCMFSLGLVSAQRGPAILDLQLITDSDVQTGSVLFAASAAGNMVGSLIAGGVYDMVSGKTWLLMVGVVMMGVLTAVTPFCSPLWLMAAVTFGASCSGACLSTATMAEVSRRWGRRREAGLQATNFSYALGSVIAPLVTGPFLLAAPQHTGHLPDHHHHHTHPHTTQHSHPHTTQHGHNETLLPASLQERVESSNLSLRLEPGLTNGSSYLGLPLGHNVTSTLSNTPPTTRVYFAFIISASVTLLSALPLIVDYIRNRKTDSKAKHLPKEKESALTPSEQAEGNKDPKSKNSSPGNVEEKKDVDATRTSSPTLTLPVWLYLVVVSWSCLYLASHTAVEVSFPSYLTTFTVLHLHWSKSKAAVATSVFWIFFATCRGAAIFVVKILSGARLVVLCSGLLVLSMLVFVLSSLYGGEVGVWVACGLAGAALSAVFPSTLSWMGKELIPVTGRVAAAVLLSANMGAMINPPILGHIMENYGTMWMAYLLLAQAVLSLLIFALLLLFRRFCLQQKYASHAVAKALADQQLEVLDRSGLKSREDSPRLE